MVSASLICFQQNSKMKDSRPMVRLMVVVKCFSVPCLHLFFAVYIIKISILKFSFVFMFSAWFLCGDNSEKITKTNCQEVDQNPKPEWQIAWWWAACCVVWEAFWYLLVELIIDVGLYNNFKRIKISESCTKMFQKWHLTSFSH